MNAAAERQRWIINMKINIYIKKVVDSHINPQRLPTAEHPTPRMSFGVSVHVSPVLPADTAAESQP